VKASCQVDVHQWHRGTVVDRQMLLYHCQLSAKLYQPMQGAVLFSDMPWLDSIDACWIMSGSVV